MLLQTTEHVDSKLADIAGRIRVRIRASVHDLIDIGLELREARALVDESSFYAWVLREFDMSRTTAWRFMSVAERYADKRSTVEHFSVSALYELAAPSTPDTVREQVEKRAESGEDVSAAEIKRLRQQVADLSWARQSLADQLSDLKNAKPEPAPPPRVVTVAVDNDALDRQYAGFVALWRSLPMSLRERFFNEHRTAFAVTGHDSATTNGGAQQVTTANPKHTLESEGTGEPDDGVDPVPTDTVIPSFLRREAANA